ncbi:MAG: SagB family peptide dehydrogenase [Pseudomonadota bacterium]
MSKNAEHPFSLRLRPDVTLTQDSDGRVLARTETLQLSLGTLPQPLASALQKLATAPMLQEDLIAAALAVGPSAMPPLLMTVTRLSEAGLLCHVLLDQGAAFATLAPLNSHFKARHSRVQPESNWRLDTSASMMLRSGTMVLQSPLSSAEVVLDDWRAAAAVHKLASGCSVDDLTASLPDLPMPLALDLLSLLLTAELIEDCAAPRRDLSPGRLWQPADLALHVQSRRGFRDTPSGATYPGEGKQPPLPVVKTPMLEQYIALPTADMEQALVNDPPFAEVVEGRVSQREFGTQPLTIDDLGAFLDRTFRVSKIYEAASKPYQISARPSPSGGGVHELEVYVAISECAGAGRGFYHYAPDTHQLHILTGKEECAEQLLNDAQQSSGATRSPQVLIVLAARFGRVTWKYQNLSYALILKHVGIAMQNMYLTATAMGLAGCALGGGDAVTFAKATGLDWLDESSVGEFMLGSRPEGG